MDELSEPDARAPASDNRAALRSILIGIGCGVAFGILFRALASTPAFGVMSVTFVGLVPIGMGFATIYPHTRSTIWQAMEWWSADSCIDGTLVSRGGGLDAVARLRLAAVVPQRSLRCAPKD